MKIASFIALRYLKANRENRFFSWISLLTIVGISIGVATMIVVLSVINGFESELRSRFLAANAHILAYRFPHGMRHHKEWEEDITRRFGDEITGVSPFVHSPTMGRKDYIIHAVLVKGVAPKQREHVQAIGEIIRPQGALDELQRELEAVQAGQPLPKEPAIIMGVGLLRVMEAKVGDTVELISPTSDDDPFGLMRPYKVVGVYDSGLQHYDNQLGIMSLPAAQALFNMHTTVTGIEIGLKEPDRSIDVAARMEGYYNLSIREWQSYNHNIFEAMRNERLIIGLIVALVAFVASFNILTTLFVSVSQKHREISILRALGARGRLILAIFFKQSILMGLIGGLGGVVLAVIISYLLANYPFIDLPDIYLLAKLPVAMEWQVYLGVTLTGVLIAALAGLYPAWVATRVEPTKGLTPGRRD